MHKIRGEIPGEMRKARLILLQKQKLPASFKIVEAEVARWSLAPVGLNVTRPATALAAIGSLPGLGLVRVLRDSGE